MSTTSQVDLAFEGRLLDSLGRLLLSERDVVAAREGLRRLSDRLDEAPAVAFKHKVTTIVSANARRLVDDPDPGVADAAARLVSHLRPDEEAALAHRDLLLAEVERISAMLGERAVVIKGFCNARFYRDVYTRWMRDIDLLCPSWVDALDLLEVLLADGYEFDLQECSWVKADPDNDRDLYGQVFLIRPIDTDFSRVDIHFGTYSIGYAGYLHLGSDLQDQLELPSGASIKVLKEGLCPLIAQAHALSDGYVSAKDVNDFVAMSLSGGIDWHATGQALREHELHPQGYRLARHILGLYDEPTVTSAAQELIEGLDLRRRWSTWQTHNRDWGLRARVNTSFAYRWRRYRGGSPLQSLVDAVRCYLFYIRRLDLAVRARSPRERLLRALMAQPDLAAWILRPDACTLLIDTGVVRHLAGLEPDDRVASTQLEDVAPGIAVDGTRGKEVVLLGRRHFIPTLDLLIPPSHARIAARV